MPPPSQQPNGRQVYADYYEMNNSSGKWKSTQGLQRGHLVLEETPILSIAEDASLAQVDKEIAAVNGQHRAYLRRLQISPEEREQNLSIIISKGFKIGAVKSKNSLNEQSSRDVALYGLFPLASRFYQSCTPNVHGHWNKVEGCMEYRVVRNLVNEEPLSISFDTARLFESREERHAQLWSEHQILCSCTTSSGSDEKRRSIGAVVTHWEHDSLVEDALQDLDAENLYWNREALLFDRYKYWRQVDPDRAAGYLREAYGEVCTLVGHDDARAAYLRSLGA